MTTSLHHETQSKTGAHSREVATLLRERIVSGKYAAGERLPTERILCEELKTNRRALRAAIQSLEQEGFLLRQPNCRATIRKTGDQSEAPPQPTEGKREPSHLVALLMYSAQSGEGASAQQRIFWGMNETLGKAGYHAVFMALNDATGVDDPDGDRDAAYIRYALARGFDGVIYYCCDFKSSRDVLRQAAGAAPLVLIDRKLTGIEADYVGVTNYQGTYEAVEHLIRLGHRRIGYVTRIEAINTVQERVIGYRDALFALLEPGFFEMVLALPSSGRDVWPAFDAMLALPPDQRPTALMCVNDSEAFYTAERLLQAGLRIPEEISLIGFDDQVRTLPNGVGLTTLAQPFEQIGAESARLFLRRLADRNAAIQEIECPTELVIRESCRPLDSSS